MKDTVRPDDCARPMEPTVKEYGPLLTHNMPCAVYVEEHAVLNCNSGVFAPSWRAQREGYMLIKPPRWMRRLLSRYSV
jgi:hypothetical protein